MLLPEAVGRVLYPKANEKMGESSSREDIYNLIILPTRISILFVSLSIGLLILACPLIFTIILPKYERGLFSAQILLFGSYFLCMARSGVNFLIAMNRQNVLLRHVVVSMVVNIVLAMVLTKTGFDIEGIATSAALSSMMLTTLLWKCVYQEIGFPVLVQYKKIFTLYIPFFILIVLFIFLIAWKNVRLEEVAVMLKTSTLFLIVFLSASWSIPVTRKWITEIYFLAMFRVRGVKETSML
jgi:O-antigen/teichoic acid export membrane protein